jgi:RimJ/RimL family protein N-acetyltransferase
VAWDDLTGTDVRVTGSPVESARFGVSIARLTVGCELPTNGPEFDAAATAVSDALARSPDDVVVVRYPAQAIRLGPVIAQSGRDVLPAGALTYWGASADSVPVITDNGLDVVPATRLPGSAADVERMVDDMIADSFAGYGNHYLANPLLDSGAALAGYQEWARRSLSGDRDALVLVDSGRPIGMATLAESHDGRAHLEVLLAGLIATAQGRGSYGVLLAACAAKARRRGLGRLIISTQVHNVRAQRAWARLGLRPFAAVETVHAVRAGLLPDNTSSGLGYRSVGPA